MVVNLYSVPWQFCGPDELPRLAKLGIITSPPAVIFACIPLHNLGNEPLTAQGLTRVADDVANVGEDPSEQHDSTREGEQVVPVPPLAPAPPPPAPPPPEICEITATRGSATLLGSPTRAAAAGGSEAGGVVINNRGALATEKLNMRNELSAVGLGHSAAERRQCLQKLVKVLAASPVSASNDIESRHGGGGKHVLGTLPTAQQQRGPLPPSYQQGGMSAG